jgi:hypothetical protein
MITTGTSTFRIEAKARETVPETPSRLSLIGSQRGIRDGNGMACFASLWHVLERQAPRLTIQQVIVQWMIGHLGVKWRTLTRRQASGG